MNALDTEFENYLKNRYGSRERLVPSQLKEIREAFYSGAGVCFLLMDQLCAGEDDEQEMAQMAELHRSIKEGMKAGISQS